MKSENPTQTQTRTTEPPSDAEALLPAGAEPESLHETQEKLRQSKAAQHDLAVTQSSILNALPAYIALIDQQGVITSVNERWRHFAGNSVRDGSASGLGQNYLEICEQANGEGGEVAADVAAGIRAVVQGEKREFALEYP